MIDEMTNRLKLLFKLLYENIDDKLKDIKVFFKSIIIGTRNIMVWAPTIYRDRQWDHSFIYNILDKKFKEMHKFWNSDKPIVQKQEEVVNDIETCLEIISRLQHDNHLEHLFDEHDRKWGKLSLTFEPCYDEDTGDINDNYCFLVSSRIYADTPEKKEQEKEEFLQLINDKEKERKKDIDNLFELMKNNIEKWWD